MQIKHSRARMRSCNHTQAHTFPSSTHPSFYPPTHMHKRIHVRALSHMHTHIHIHAYTTQAHTCTQCATIYNLDSWYQKWFLKSWVVQLLCAFVCVCAYVCVGACVCFCPFVWVCVYVCLCGVRLRESEWNYESFIFYTLLLLLFWED